MITNGMLLDAKQVMDDAIPDLQDLYELVPGKLHADLDAFIKDFKRTLACCDVADRYVEKE